MRDRGSPGGSDISHRLIKKKGTKSEMQDAVKRLGIKADRIETIFSGSSHFDVMDAWWSLTAKGMKQIVSMIAEFVNGSGLRLTGRELRFCG